MSQPLCGLFWSKSPPLKIIQDLPNGFFGSNSHILSTLISFRSTIRETPQTFRMLKKINFDICFPSKNGAKHKIIEIIVQMHSENHNEVIRMYYSIHKFIMSVMHAQHKVKQKMETNKMLTATAKLKSKEHSECV